MPEDKSLQCPLCGQARYNSRGKPFEEVFYFPLKEKLKSLLRLSSFRKSIDHEFRRQSHNQNEDIISDVYDSPAWKSLMGPPVHPNNRIGKKYWDMICLSC